MSKKKCIFCGQETKKQNKFYCSRYCKSEHIKKNNEKECKFCGKVFSIKYNKYFCSQKCKTNYTKKKNKKECKFCRKVFTSGVNKYFCSRSCSNIGMRGIRSERIKIICKFCGKEFEQTLNKVKRTNPKYCSMFCSNEYAKKYKTRIRKKQRITKTCKFCKKIFQVHPYRKDAIFCSCKCHDDSRRITKKCPTCKKKFTFPKWEAKTYCSINCARKGVQRTNAFSNSIYEAAKKEFKNLKIQQEYRIIYKNKKYFVDFLISDKICVECDGQYWHCDSRVYPAKYFHKQARKTAKEIWEHDKKKEEDIKLLGYYFVRIKEYDWLKNQQKETLELKEKINEILKDCKN